MSHSRMLEWLTDRGVQASLVLCALAAGGFAGLGLAWRGAAATLGVYVQLPFVVSGAVGGVALAGACAGILAVHVERRAAAVDRLWMDAAIASAAEIADALPAHLAARRWAGEHPVLVRNGRTVHLSHCRFAAGKSLPLLHGWEPGLRRCEVCKPTLGEGPPQKASSV